MATIFSKIVSGEIPSYKVMEDENYLAFLDINPLVGGHTLVIPKLEEDYIFDLDDEILSGLILFAKKVAKKMDAVLTCERIGVSVIGLEVPHAHVHLIPMNRVSDMDFSKPKLDLGEEQMRSLAERISAG